IKLENIIGESVAIRNSKKEALIASKSTSTVLITGESGTGKELFARAIHNHSNRVDNPFIAVNCAAIPDNLLESELFGYEEGAFTGAKKGGKLGMFEVAHKGSIFLDEIGDMSLHLQSKLLRVLQEKELNKIGSKSNVSIDVRIIAATNKDLEKMVQNGTFREDLYYRLNVIPIKLPSLRERKEDIPLIIKHMVKE
ncbi:sigma 54-interacting transcriptional regulator, partial [Clostridioides difficile]|nr:sigma 54-interacting transcriptional regulator [Clostridioides difficile]